MTRRSDALQVLVEEVVALERDIAQACGIEEEARQESVAARAALDAARGRREALEGRRATTATALKLIQGRDEVSEDTVAALMVRARR